MALIYAQKGVAALAKRTVNAKANMVLLSVILIVPALENVVALKTMDGHSLRHVFSSLPPQ